MAPPIIGTLDPHLFLRHRPPCTGKLSCDLQAFTLPEFTDPLRLSVLALAASVILVVLATFVRRPPPQTHRWSRAAFSAPLPIAGLLFAGVAVASFQLTGHLVTGLAIGIGLLVTGGLVADLALAPIAPRMLLAIPGAVVLARGAALPDGGFVPVLVAVTTVLGSGLVADLDQRVASQGHGPVLLAVTVFGLYESVPDPDFALLLVGAALPLALLGWPRPVSRLGGAGATAACGFIAWAAAVGGRGLQSAIVAGVASLGLFIIEPVAHLVLRNRRSVLERLPHAWWVPMLVGVVQLGLDASFTRIAGAGRSLLEAGIIAMSGLAAATAVACLLSSPRPASLGPSYAPILGSERGATVVTPEEGGN